jgi:hypothetical protein
MEPLPHGYTNATVTDRRVVVKTYQGPESQQRQSREELALLRLAGRLPVPTLLTSTAGVSTTAYVSGVPGQQAIEDGHASEVLNACGRLLAELQAIDPGLLFGAGVEAGAVLVHNDFGPNNLLMRSDLRGARLLCDWEWVTVGDRDTDLAWAEFIVRLHHPAAVPALAALFEGYGDRPAWEARQAAMSRRAGVHREFVRRWHGDPAAELWTERLAAIASWREVPPPDPNRSGDE